MRRTRGLNTICAFTSVCEEDGIWVDQYLAEIDRLVMPFAVHLDRWSPTSEVADRLLKHPLCVGSTRQNKVEVEFNETHKQRVFDLVVGFRFKWAMAWDIDETFEASACTKIGEVLDQAATYDSVIVKWWNLWDDPYHIRVDGPFGSGYRDKIYNLSARRWKFCSLVVNGPKLMCPSGEPLPNSMMVHYNSDLVCLHHGMMTRELREQHKARWDRIYSTALRGDNNPYGIWNYALDEVKYPPVVVKYGESP